MLLLLLTTAFIDLIHLSACTCVCGWAREMQVRTVARQRMPDSFIGLPVSEPANLCEPGFGQAPD